ncbi:hypothetical protein [Polaromonas sp.]|uniref:hypothetical protein n=1 Tax=Polaromonas sp. TaxID=1869339 RepID=UPI00352A94B5
MSKKLYVVTGRNYGDDDDTTYLVWVKPGESAADLFKERLQSETGKSPDVERPVFITNTLVIGETKDGSSPASLKFVLERQLDESMREWPDGATVKIRSTGELMATSAGNEIVGWAKRGFDGELLTLNGKKINEANWVVVAELPHKNSAAKVNATSPAADIPRIVVTIEGGNLQSITCDAPTDVVLVDFDTQGCTESRGTDRLTTIPATSGGRPTQAFVGGFPVDVNPDECDAIFTLRDAHGEEVATLGDTPS